MRSARHSDRIETPRSIIEADVPAHIVGVSAPDDEVGEHWTGSMLSLPDRRRAFTSTLLVRSPPRPATPIVLVHSNASQRILRISSALAGLNLAKQLSDFSGWRHRQHRKCRDDGMPVCARLVFLRGFRIPSTKAMSFIIILLNPACGHPRSVQTLISAHNRF
jgi:hypothetical protein